MTIGIVFTAIAILVALVAFAKVNPFLAVGFVLIVPIVFAISSRFDMPAVVVAVPALAALSVAHGLLPALVLLGSTAIEIAAPQMAAAVPLLRFITHPDIVLLLARIV